MIPFFFGEDFFFKLRLGRGDRWPSLLSEETPEIKEQKRKKKIRKKKIKTQKVASGRQESGPRQ